MKTSKWRLFGMGFSCSALTYLGTSMVYDINYVPLFALMLLSMICMCLYLLEDDVD